MSNPLGAALILAVLVVVGCSVPETTSPEVRVTQPSASPSEPSSPEDRYLAALRIRDIPVSVTGASEIQIGKGVCKQLANGASAKWLAKELISVGWTIEQAEAVVRVAQEHLCA